MEYNENDIEFWKIRAKLLNEQLDCKNKKCKKIKRMVWLFYIVGNAVGVYGGYTIAKAVFETVGY